MYKYIDVNTNADEDFVYTFHFSLLFMTLQSHGKSICFND